jgi:spermidine/putrescine transport system permease protein
VKTTWASRARWGAVGICLAVLYLPLVVILCFSFNEAPRGMVWTGFSWRWYTDVWENQPLMEAVENSLRVATLATLLSGAIGTFAAFVVSTSGSRSFRFFAPLVLLPVLTPDLLISLANALAYRALGVSKGLSTIALSQSVVGAAYVALLITVRLRSIDFAAYVRAAQSLGASPLRIATDHFAPLAAMPLLVGAMIAAAFSLQDFLYAFFCGGVGSSTLSVHVYGLVRFGPHGGLNVIYVLAIAAAATVFHLFSRTSKERSWR